MGILSAPIAIAANDTTSATKSILKSLPVPLSKSDAALYQQIFAVQKAGNWRNANRLIKKLTNKILLGHLQAQRYLHPTHYRSRYKELAVWLKHYADHPDAKRIYKLAVRRKPKIIDLQTDQACQGRRFFLKAVTGELNELNGEVCATTEMRAICTPR